MQTWVPDIIYALIYFVAFFLYHGLNLSLFAFFPILSSDFPSKLDLISCFLSLILKLSLILIVHAWYDELGKPLSPHANCLTREEAGQTVNPKDSQFSLKKERWWKSMNRKRVVVKSRNKLKTVHFDINLRDIYNCELKWDHLRTIEIVVWAVSSSYQTIWNLKNEYKRKKKRPGRNTGREVLIC